MDQIIGFVVLLIILSFLEKVLRGQKGKSRRPPPAEGDWEAEAERDELEQRGATLRDLLAEELGLNLERKPTVRSRPETPAAEGRADPWWASQGDRAATAQPTGGRESVAPPEIERVVYYPTPARPERDLPKRGAPAGPAAAAAVRAAEARKLASSIRRQHGAVRTRRPKDDRLPVPTREAVSLERPRRPEDHDLFHERYAIPEPVSSHEEFHRRYMDSRPRAELGRTPVLPEYPEWSAVQKAIVWSEILGPPKGLE